MKAKHLIYALDTFDFVIGLLILINYKNSIIGLLEFLKGVWTLGILNFKFNWDILGLIDIIGGLTLLFLSQNIFFNFFYFIGIIMITKALLLVLITASS